jgi:hypothetical protein
MTRAARRLCHAWAAACLLAAAAAPARAEPAAAARAGIAAQVAAWNSGDLEAALRGYCESSEITWVHHGGVTRGYDDFARSMRETFGGGPDGMGRLAIEILDARDLGGGDSLVVVRWSVVREGKTPMGGVSTQLWADCAGTARVVFEHSD